MDYLYTYCGKVDKIELEKNKVTMMIAYTPKFPMDILTNHLEDGQNFTQSGNQYIPDMMIISKWINLLNNTGLFPNDTNEWNRKQENSKILIKFKTHFFRSQEWLNTQVTMATNGGYNAFENHVYGGITPSLRITT